MKLHGRLLAAGTALIVAVLAMAGAGYWRGRGQALREAETSTQDLARALEQHTLVVLRGIERALSVLPERIDVTALRRPDQRLAFHQMLDRWARADPAGAHFMILDESGIVRHRSHSPDPLPIDNADRAYFAVHRERADTGLFIGEPVIARSGPAEGEFVIAFSRRVPAADGSLGGVVVAGMPAKVLMEFYESLNVGRSGVVSLFRRDGVLLARSPAAGVVGQRFDQIELFRKELPKAEYGTYRSRFVTDGDVRITSYRAVPQYPLIVAVSLSEAEVMAAWHESAMFGAAALLTLTAAIGLLVVWLSTALKRDAATARALAMNEAKARSTLETVADGVIAIDARGAVRSFNAAAEQMFGCAAAAAIGREAASLFEAGQIGDAAGWLRWADAAPANGRRHEIMARRADGRAFPAELRLGRAPGAAGAEDLVIATLRDLTEEKALRHQFEQSQKLEAIGHLTGGIAHDFGNILAAIAMNVELSLRHLPENSAVRGFMDDAGRAARSGRDIVQRLLAFARKQALDPSPGDLNALVQDALPLLLHGRSHGVSIETRLSGGLGLVFLDRSGIENALLNLVINAGDAMPDGGKVIVETGSMEVGAARAAEWGIKRGPYATLSVCDSGLGMTKDVASRIFEPFFSTKVQGRGTGLGLSMVHGFVMQSGGHILVDTKPNLGTRVTLLFPMQRRIEDAPGKALAPLEVFNAAGIGQPPCPRCRG